MEVSAPLESIEQLIRDSVSGLGPKRVCLLTGAGASISSGGLTFADFKARFFAEILREDRFATRHSSRHAAEAVNAYFENTPQQEVRARLVEAAFTLTERDAPSDAYFLLALALEKRALGAIVTTNFDTMLEKAERMLGLSVLRVHAKGIGQPDTTDYLPDSHDRVPYLKLHGCLNGRSITHITEAELLNGVYPAAYRKFLKTHMGGSDVIVAGYGGFDTALAEVLKSVRRSARGRVYWCSPSPPNPEAPLVQAWKNAIIHVACTFDELIEAIARPVLEMPSFTDAKPVFLSCLLDWRVGRANQDYIKAHARRAGRDIRPLLIHRREVELGIDHFLMSDRPMAVVTGPSGIGKSALALRLMEKHDGRLGSHCLVVSARSAQATGAAGDFATLLVDRIIGGLGSAGPFSFTEFEKWLRVRRTRLIIYLDALNEVSADLERVAGLLRDVVRFSYFLPAHSPIRVIVSLRQETWNRLLGREDTVRLSAVCWSPQPLPNTVHAIHIGPLSDGELREALDLLCDQLNCPSVFPELPPQALNPLRDPFLLAHVMDEVLDRRSLEALNLVHGPPWRIYADLFRAKLGRDGTGRYHEDFVHILARAAALTVERNEDRFRPIDLAPQAGGSGPLDIKDSLIDLGFLSWTEDGFLCFVHERMQEFFLAKALELRYLDIPLRTPYQLDEALRKLDSRHQFMAALRTYFLLLPKERLPLVRDIAFDVPLGLDAAARTRLQAFAKELMVDLASGDPDIFVEMFRAAAEEMAEADPKGVILDSQDSASRYWRSLIQAAAHLPDRTALTLLTLAATIGARLPRTEANIHATDVIVRLLTRDPDGFDLFHIPEVAAYYTDPKVPWLARIGRVFGLMSQIGPDNTAPEEYRLARKGAAEAVARIFAERAITADDIAWFADFIYAERDRYVFNGNLDGMKNFFRNPNRSVFIEMLDRIEVGKTLTLADIDKIRVYTEEIYHDLEFQLANFIFILSASNNFEITADLWESVFDTFTNETPPTTIDFFQATLPYIYVINDRPYDGRIDRHIDRVLAEFPATIEYEPGRERGTVRGFTDAFDKVFEDGFNPIASYATLAPSSRRRALSWREERDSAPPGLEILPIYERHFREALDASEMPKAIRILHALGQYTSLWPREGLRTFVLPLRIDHPVIHRATIRLLAETYNRHPVETLRFLAESGLAIPPGDLRDIRARANPHTGRRQFEGLQWGRVIHFLLTLPEARRGLIQVLRILYGASDLEQALHDIAIALGWMK